MPISSFAELHKQLRSGQPVRIAVAGAASIETAKAVSMLISEGLVSHAVVSGDGDALERNFSETPSSALTLVPSTGAEACTRAAVEAIRQDAADVLMKGDVDSPSYLRAVLDRDYGLRAGGVLSNVTVAEMPSLDRLIAATDNGIMPLPDLDQKRQIVLNTTPLFKGLGTEPVRVAAVCASEKTSQALPATLDAEALAKEALSGGLPGFELGGPMGYDVAVSTAAAQAKGLDGMPAAGKADLLLFANIDAANAVAKSWKFHGQAKTGSIVLGARCPVLLNSRSDKAEARINAILLAAAVLAGAS